MTQEKYTELQNKLYRNRPNAGKNAPKNKKFQAYLKCWRDEILDPLEKKLDVTVSGYDPSISFYDGEDMQASAQIPLWLAEKILGIRN